MNTSRRVVDAEKEQDKDAAKESQVTNQLTSYICELS